MQVYIPRSLWRITMGSVQRIVCLSLLSLLVAAGCGAGHRSAGEACAVTADCDTALACFDGKCAKDDGACHAASKACERDEQCCTGLYCNVDVCESIPGSSCISAGALCTDSKYCCGSLTCQNSRCSSAGPSCKGLSAACATSDVCCTGLACERFGLFCQSAVALKLGQPCTADAQCASKQCQGYCTKGCSSNAQCTDVTFCIPTNLGNICVPWCGTGSNTRCSVYTTTCQAAPDIAGSSQAVCLGR